MSGDIVFLDTNILVYLVDRSDARKNLIATKLVVQSNASGLGVISRQVVHEWFNTVFRKASVLLRQEDAEPVYRSMIEPLWRIDSHRAIVNGALALYRDHSFSWWDSLIVSAAIEAKSSVLLSEDLQHGREIGGLRIENPFL